MIGLQRFFAWIITLCAVALVGVGVWGIVVEAGDGRWWMVFVIIPGQLAGLFFAAIFLAGAYEDRL